MRSVFFLLVGFLIITSCGDKKVTTSSPNVTKAVDLEKMYGELYQYYHSNPISQAQKDENTIIEYATEKGLDVKRTNTGLFYQIVEEGTGPLVKRGEALSTEYKGYFTDGKEFDSSYKRNRPLNFNHGQMVAGWNEALLLMKKGSKAKLLLPSHLGYGSRGFPGAVPPNRVIIFDLELLNQ